MIYSALAIEYSYVAEDGVTLRFQALVPLGHESVALSSRVVTDDSARWRGWMHSVPTSIGRGIAIIVGSEVFFVDQAVHDFLDAFPGVDALAQVREVEMTEKEYESFEFFQTPRSLVQRAAFTVLTPDAPPGKL